MQLACHDLLVCKYLTLYIRVLLFIMCFNFFHHAPLGNQFVLKELACLNKVLPTYLPYLPVSMTVLAFLDGSHSFTSSCSKNLRDQYQFYSNGKCLNLSMQASLSIFNKYFDGRRTFCSQAPCSFCLCRNFVMLVYCITYARIRIVHN